MFNRLKNLRLTSVDLVRAGANQEADICLFKSDSPEDPPERSTDPVEKDYTTFDQINNTRELNDKVWRYSDALNCSIRSIQDDRDLDKDQKCQMMKQSLKQFTEAMTELIGQLASVSFCDENAVMAKADPGCDMMESVEKFNHFHDERGRFTTASGGIAHATVTGGGSTTDLRHGTSPKSGYMLVTKEDAARGQQVSINKYWSKEKKRKEIRKALDEYKEKNKDVLTEGGDNGKFMGTWFDKQNGTLWLDVSTNFTSKSKAIKAANQAGEIAIWDVKAGGEIRLRDTHE